MSKEGAATGAGGSEEGMATGAGGSEEGAAAGAGGSEELGTLAHELLNTLFATDLLLERALEHEEHGTDPMDDVRRARAGVQESLDVIKRRFPR